MEQWAYPVCAFTKEISEEECAEITSHFGILTWIEAEPKPTR